MGRHGAAEVVTGAIVLLVAAFFLAYALSRSGTSVGGGGYTLYANFSSAEGLNVGGDVRIAGVKVGSVTAEKLNPKTYEAVVSLSVNNDVQLPKDTGATIVSESLLGGKYVSLSPGGDTTNLKPGQTITITQGSVNLEELLGKFIFSASSLSGAKSGGSSGSSGNGSSGNGSPGNGSPGNGSGQDSGGGLPPLGK